MTVRTPPLSPEQAWELSSQAEKRYWSTGGAFYTVVFGLGLFVACGTVLLAFSYFGPPWNGLPRSGQLSAWEQAFFLGIGALFLAGAITGVRHWRASKHLRGVRDLILSQPMPPRPPPAFGERFGWALVLESTPQTLHLQMVPYGRVIGSLRLAALVLLGLGVLLLLFALVHGRPLPALAMAGKGFAVLPALAAALVRPYTLQWRASHTKGQPSELVIERTRWWLSRQATVVASPEIQSIVVEGDQVQRFRVLLRLRSGEQHVLLRESPCEPGRWHCERMRDALQRVMQPPAPPRKARARK